MERTKAITLVILALFGMVIVLQNTETVETRLLFWSISMPRAVLLLGTSLIGFAAGIIVSFFWAVRGRAGKSLPKKNSIFYDPLRPDISPMPASATQPFLPSMSACKVSIATCRLMSGSLRSLYIERFSSNVGLGGA